MYGCLFFTSYMVDCLLDNCYVFLQVLPKFTWRPNLLHRHNWEWSIRYMNMSIHLHTFLKLKYSFSHFWEIILHHFEHLLETNKMRTVLIFMRCFIVILWLNNMNKTCFGTEVFKVRWRNVSFCLDREGIYKRVLIWSTNCDIIF